MNKQPDEAQPSVPEQPQYRKVSEEELKRILTDHREWLKMKGEKGIQANLVGANLQEANLIGAYLQEANLNKAGLRGAELQGAELQGASLRDANLHGANLHKARLQGADLSLVYLKEANLRGANLSGAILQEANLNKADLLGADLSGAILQGADLSDAKLSDVIGLLADKLAGANLSNATLPEKIAAFDGLARAEETSRIARPIFIGILAGCVYSWLTIATTTDARLLTNSASSPLPIIGAEVPIAGFYWAAPFILLSVYFYFHLYLQRLWAGLADLPAVFPDGRPLDKKVYPWLLSGLVRAHFKLLRGERTLLSRLENWTAVFLAWWIVPLTLLIFWGRYLPRHEWIGTGWHIALLILSIGCAILLHRHAVRTLRRDMTAFRWRKPWLDHRTYEAAVTLGFGVLFALISLGAIEGDVRRDRSSIIVRPDVATWVPYAFDRVGYRTFANLRETDVSTKPANWTGNFSSMQNEAPRVRGAQLFGRDLRDADVAQAFLINANLRGANLQGADLTGANLWGADLRGANLQETVILEAIFERANLGNANLRQAKRFGEHSSSSDGLYSYSVYLQERAVTDVVPVNFMVANLLDANLQGADLLDANFRNANLQGADLTDANLQGANLQNVKLQGANLLNANLQGANFGVAYFQGAELGGANLQGANLEAAQGLTQHQLDQACGDEETKLPKGLTIATCREEQK